MKERREEKHSVLEDPQPAAKSQQKASAKKTTNKENQARKEKELTISSSFPTTIDHVSSYTSVKTPGPSSHHVSSLLPRSEKKHYGSSSKSPYKGEEAKSAKRTAEKPGKRIDTWRLHGAALRDTPITNFLKYYKSFDPKGSQWKPQHSRSHNSVGRQKQSSRDVSGGRDTPGA